MGKWAFAFDRFNIVPNEELFPFVVVRVAKMADVRMGRQFIPFLNALANLFARHDAAFLSSGQAFKDPSGLEPEHHRIAKVTGAPLFIGRGIAEDEYGLSFEVEIP